MSQALAFPLGVLHGAFTSLASNKNENNVVKARLRLGIASACLYLAASTIFAPRFAFGYDLYPPLLKMGASAVFLATAGLVLNEWKTSVQSKMKSTKVWNYSSRIVRGSIGALWSIAPSKQEQNNALSSSSTAALYSMATVGFLWFTLAPIVSSYPLATVPSILGKRLARPAVCFSSLASVECYCLKVAADQNHDLVALRHSLGFGSMLHLVLIALKLIGIDDGGFLLPGNGLWQVYPAMLAVPFATTVSLMLHGLVCLAAFSDPQQQKE